MKLIFKLLVVLFMLFQSCNGQDKNDNSQKHIQFLKDFYNEYVINNNRRMVYPILEKYCTEDFYKSLVEKMKTGEIDYSPVLYAQDFHVSLLDNLDVVKDSLKINTYVVSYFYENLENWNSTHIIKYELIDTQEGLKIKNIGEYELR